MEHDTFFTNLKKTLTDIGDALRDINVTDTKYKFSQFADAIRSGKEVAYQQGLDALAESISPVSIGTSYTCPHDGFIIFKAYATVTNHDNSYEMDASIVARHNGTVWKSTGTHINSWGGGSMSLEGNIRVKKGDTFSCSINTSNDNSINWSNTYTGTYFNTSVD